MVNEGVKKKIMPALNHPITQPPPLRSTLVKWLSLNIRVLKVCQGTDQWRSYLVGSGMRMGRGCIEIQQGKILHDEQPKNPWGGGGVTAIYIHTYTHTPTIY